MAFDVEGALKVGTEKEIADYLSKIHGFDAAAARKENISDREIIDRLASMPQPSPPSTTASISDEKDELVPAAYGVPMGVVGLGYGAGIEGVKGARNVARWFKTQMERDAALGMRPETATPPAERMAPGEAKPTSFKKYGTSMHGGLYTPVQDMSTIYRTGEEVAKFKQANPTWTVQEGTGIAVPPPSKAEQALIDAEKRSVKGRTKAALSGIAHSKPLAAGRVLGDITAPGYGAYQLGSQGAQAYNRLKFGETPREQAAGVANLLGAGAGAAAFSRNPRIRYPAVIASGGLGALADLIAGQTEEKAAGGLVHMADGGGTPKSRIAKGLVDIAVGKEPPAIKKIKQEALPLWQKFGYDPKKIGQQYPDVLPPTLETDPKTGKTFLSKQLSDEARAVQKARQAAQKEIDSGSSLYKPFFDITKRSYVNPADYPLSEKTIDLTMPKKAETLAKHRGLAQSPEATARLEAAYGAAQGSPTAHGFYMMKQLQDEYVKELGPELGRFAFKRDFADPMAATTGGQTPTANLMMTAMHNYFANKGVQMPSKGYDIPYPVGGNKLQSNIDMSHKLFNTGSLSAADSPKRFNFSSNFLGHSDRPTIDEQMMGLFQPGGKGAPDWYGVNEEAVNVLAKKRGVEPVNYQEVAWAGAKGYPGQPMIEDVNQMLYRTHRITGEPQEEVLRRFIRRSGPMYGITGLGALGLQETGGVNNPE